MYRLGWQSPDVRGSFNMDTRAGLGGNLGMVQAALQSADITGKGKDAASSRHNTATEPWKQWDIWANVCMLNVRLGMPGNSTEVICVSPKSYVASSGLDKIFAALVPTLHLRRQRRQRTHDSIVGLAHASRPLFDPLLPFAKACQRHDHILLGAILRLSETAQRPQQ